QSLDSVIDYQEFQASGTGPNSVFSLTSSTCHSAQGLHAPVAESISRLTRDSAAQHCGSRMIMMAF
ncbi:MAG: hypothetical protein MK441_11360, partial [SAR324 cluster bacterium]|nr:hypothetical protein [SAR324 cluster bacterium]